MEEQAEQLQKWWQQLKQHWVAIEVVALILVVVIALIIVEIRVYGTGFAGKTLWDWLQLLAALAVPIVVGFGAVWFTTQQGKVADAENKDNQREAALQAYMDKLSELLIHENLRESKPDSEIRDIARARTLALLQRLDSTRKGSVLKFLYETGLIKGENCVINLSDADLSRVNVYPDLLLATEFRAYDLSGINLSNTHLERAILGGTKLSGANLSGAMLHNTILEFADLRGANLRGCILSYTQLNGAKLDGAILDGAKFIKTTITQEQLNTAKSLKGASMPDGSIHP